jgi:hypothetical protein
MLSQVMLVKTTWLGRRGWGMMPTVLQTVVMLGFKHWMASRKQMGN